MNDQREGLLLRIKTAYREMRKIERQLARPPFTRVFKDLKCQSAKKLQERRQGLVDAEGKSLSDLTEAFRLLPEVGLAVVGTAQNACAFAKQLCKPKRNPRFLRGQRTLGVETP